MEQALVVVIDTLPSQRRLFIDEAAAALPAHLHDFPVLDQQRHGALCACDFAHPSARSGIGFHVVLNELAALPLQPVTHFAGVGTASSPIKFKFGHDLNSLDLVIAATRE